MLDVDSRLRDLELGEDDSVDLAGRAMTNSGSGQVVAAGAAVCC